MVEFNDRMNIQRTPHIFCGKNNPLPFSLKKILGNKK